MDFSQPLLRGKEEDNAEPRKVRAHVERTFAQMNSWKILRNCRQKGDGPTVPDQSRTKYGDQLCAGASPAPVPLLHGLLNEPIGVLLDADNEGHVPSGLAPPAGP